MKNIFIQIICNKYIYVPVLTWFFIQLFKVFYDYFETKKLNLKRLIGAGGMPSSHSAIAMSLTFLVGKNVGFDSSSFAACLIFSFIVMYDAAGVRREAGKQASLLNKIVESPELSGVETQETLVELLGHTPTQVFVGAIIGIIVGLIF